MQIDHDSRWHPYGWQQPVDHVARVADPSRLNLLMSVASTTDPTPRQRATCARPFIHPPNRGIINTPNQPTCRRFQVLVMNSQNDPIG